MFYAMRTLRITGDGTSYYHVMSRIIERRFYMGEDEKRVFADMMYRVAAFSGVEILTFCVMSNHFHILIKVPERREVSDDELFRRLRYIYRTPEFNRIVRRFERWRGNVEMQNQIRNHYIYRMYDLSEFMKTLKQRYSIWYNRNHDERLGTLWEDRFKSVLVQNPDGRRASMGCRALLTMAAYIELNPVRAGIVDDPKDYFWCGYGQAVCGKQQAQTGLAQLLVELEYMRKGSAWDKIQAGYRSCLFGKGAGRVFEAEKVLEVFRRKGHLTVPELTKCRMRYFSEGLIFGGEEFVADVFHRKRRCFHAKRHPGACKVREKELDGFFVAQRLQGNAVEASKPVQ